MGNVFSESKENELNDVKHKMRQLRKKEHYEIKGGRCRISEGEFKGLRINKALDKLSNIKTKLQKEILNEQNGGTNQTEHINQTGGRDNDKYLYKYNKYKAKIAKLNYYV